MTYSLPDLPYDHGALAPHIAGEIMELHHSKHHQTYVNGLNDTLEKLAAAREKGDFGAIVGLEKALAFNLGGHINHSLFWKVMKCLTVPSIPFSVSATGLLGPSTRKVS